PAPLAAGDAALARSVAAANEWDRQIQRALQAFTRRTRLTHPQVVEELRRRATYGVTELERFADCSSMWFVERLIDPRAIDAELDPRLRGGVAHQARFRSYSGLPHELAVERGDADRGDQAMPCARRRLEAAEAG